MDKCRQSVCKDPVSVSRGVLISQCCGRRRVTCTMHEFGGSGTCGSSQGQSGMSQVMKMQIRATDLCTSTLPRNLKHISRQRNSGLAIENQGRGRWTRESLEVFFKSRHQVTGDRERSLTREVLGALDG